MADKLPMPSKLSKYSPDIKVTNYIKQLHDVVAQLQKQVAALQSQVEELS